MNPQAEESVAVITGASSGIGARVALELGRRRWNIVLAARRAERLDELAHRCEQAGGRAMPVPTDVADEGQVRELIARAAERFGRIDVLVNNAGFGHFGAVHEIADRDMRDVFDVNFFGVFYGCKAVAPVMIGQRSGHIFNLSSVIGKRGTPFHAAYCASKFAVGGLTDALRVELAPYDVRVTLVCPALTETEFFGKVRNGEARSRSDYLTRAKKMPPERVAGRIVRTIGKDAPEIVFTAGGKFLVLLGALWPEAADRIMKVYHDDLIRDLARLPQRKD